MADMSSKETPDTQLHTVREMAVKHSPVKEPRVSSNIEQSGRSSSTLHAERVATSLREYGKNPSQKTTSTPNISHKTVDHSSYSGTASPAVPSTSSKPRRVVSSTTHIETILEIEASSHGDSSTAPTHTLNSIFPLQSSPRIPPIRQLRSKSTPELKSRDIRRPSSVLTMRDLGTDYTRYFNPFSDSGTSDVVDLPTAPLTVCSSSIVNPFQTPNSSTIGLDTNPDPEKNGSLIDDRLGAPYNEHGSLAWPLWTDKEEADDHLHLPHPDDDTRYKVHLKDYLTRANIAPTVGLFLMMFGLLFIFIGLPVLSWTGIIRYSTPLNEMPDYNHNPDEWSTVNHEIYPLLRNIRTSLIDPDTPQHAMKRTGELGEDYTLVFSDEFNTPNRTFYEGDDAYFFAPDIWYHATNDLEWYDPDAVTTRAGVLELRLDKYRNHNLDFRSGMLNSWNHLCFKGGIFEISMSLPGPAGVMGLWPGAWTLGNLGRPGYLATTDGVWPYTYQACDEGITPNQSSPDGLSSLPGQRLPSCTCPNADHPTPGRGRGAPEIDIAEAGASFPPSSLPIATQSYQVAPFDVWWYPDYNFTAFPSPLLSSPNSWTGGPYQQAISATTSLNHDWYDGVAYQRYSFEYVPGSDANGSIVWQVGGKTMMSMDGRAIGANGNVAARQVSEEPMAIVINLGISESWTVIEWEKLVFPAVMRVDYVRWWQKTGEELVTCDPPGWETTDYIKEHPRAYANPNLTSWEEAGYEWPKHRLNSEC
jgi:beta-glucanase (GH16 family)